MLPDFIIRPQGKYPEAHHVLQPVNYKLLFIKLGAQASLSTVNQAASDIV